MLKGRRRLHDEETVNLAVQEVQEKALTIRRAAKKYGIPKSTLSDYVKNKRRLEVDESCIDIKVLSDYEESILVKWILDQAQKRIPVTKKDLREEAHKMVIENPRKQSYSVSTEKGPGPKWTTLFIARHPEIENIMSCKRPNIFQNLNPAETVMIEVEADPLPMLNGNMDEQVDNCNLKLKGQMKPFMYYNADDMFREKDPVNSRLRSKYKQGQYEGNNSQFKKSQKSVSNGNEILHHKKLSYKKGCKQPALKSSDLHANLNQRITRTAGLKKKIKLSATHGLLYTCSICKIRFEAKTKRDYHVFYRHNFGVQLKCNLCECVFQKNGKLNSHMKTCNLSCAHCTFITRDKISMKYHMFTSHLCNEQKTTFQV